MSKKSKKSKKRTISAIEQDHNNPRKKRRLNNDIFAYISEESIEEIMEPPQLIECCVCMRSNLDNLSILVDNESDIQENGIPMIATLGDCDEGIDISGTIFLSCCKIHGICYNCLKTIALSFDNHLIGASHSFIPCPSPFNNGEDGCVSISGMSNYFTHSDIRKLLDDEEFAMYMNHAQRYQFPGYELVPCPRPLLDNNIIIKCGALILVPIDAIQHSIPGHLILQCNQSEECFRRSCYHCQSLIRQRGYGIPDDIGGVVNDPDVTCEHCITKTENVNPQALNRYFYNPNKMLKDGRPIMFRNEELTKELVLSQLMEVAEADKLYTRCFECLTTIYKTEQCNTITHCGIERCYVCGRSGSNESHLGDHWDVSGMKGCPRFDHSVFWNQWGNCNFKCRESYCYGDQVGQCRYITHQEGIENMVELRKRSHIFHAIKSLLPEQQQSIIDEIVNIENYECLKKYLPKVVCNEYQMFLPDLMYDKLKEAEDYLNDGGGDDNYNAAEQQESLYIINKLRDYEFKEINYGEHVHV